MFRQLLFILLFLSQLGLAQQIKYNLVAIDSCAGMIEYELLYEIRKEDRKFIIGDTLGTVYLPDTGTYIVRLCFPEFYSLIEDSLTLQVTEYKDYSDTVALRKLTECMGGLHSGFSGFCGCGLSKSNGYQVDYYPNGKKRIEGIFKDGYAVGKLSYYYPSGQIKQIRYYDGRGKGRIRKTLLYDRNGKEIK